MPEIRLEGCGSRPLAGYLKALGVLRIVSKQADPQAMGRWRTSRFELSSTLDLDDLIDFFLTRYRPTPIVSPWNSGSGFFESRPDALQTIESSADPRLSAFADTVRMSRLVLRELNITEAPASDKILKARLLRHLRSVLADDAIGWVDAVTSLTEAGARYSPIFGGGSGNDGNFDLADNFAQSVLRIIGPDSDSEQAVSWLRDALGGSSTPLIRKMSLGHFRRDKSPVNSPEGESEGLGNPWDFVLVIEGSLTLAASAARRHAASQAVDLVAPFTARTTAAGYSSAVDQESGVAELWLPLWTAFTSFEEIDAVAREARAQVSRRRAKSGLDFARAAGELGVARGITSFERYAILERAGQSNLAVSAGTIAVAARSEMHVLDEIDPWLTNTLRFIRGTAPRKVVLAIRQLEMSVFSFANKPTKAKACTVIEQLGHAESSIAASGRQANEAFLIPLRNASANPWLFAADDGTPEFSIAVSIASLGDKYSASNLPAVRDYLHGTSVGERGRRIYDSNAKKVLPRSADPLKLLAALHEQRHLDAARSERKSTPDSDSAGSIESDLAFDFGIPGDSTATHLFATGNLDNERIMRLVGGLCLFDFRNTTWGAGSFGDCDGTPSPVFDVLQLAWYGTSEHATRARRGWAARLARGNVAYVIRNAHVRLRQARLEPIVGARNLLAQSVSGELLLAALLVKPQPRDLLRTQKRMTISLAGNSAGDTTKEEDNAGTTKTAT